MHMVSKMVGPEDLDLSQPVNNTCEFIDLEHNVCRYVEAGLRPGRYTDSMCALCLAGLEHLRSERG